MNCDTDLRLVGVTGVTWEDDDGQVYRRTIEDGEIRDVPVKRR